MIITTMAEVTPGLQRIPDIENILDATFGQFGFVTQIWIEHLDFSGIGQATCILYFLALHLKTFLGK